MPDFREFDDVVYIAGLTFQSEYGVHEAGTEVKEAPTFQNLQVLIDNRFLYPVAPDKGYNYLPPHLFNHINVRKEVMAKIEGALSPNPDHFQDGHKPEPMLLAEREARQKLNEMNGDTEDAQKLQEKAREDAKTIYRTLETVDANPAVQDKPADLKKLYKGDQQAWEQIQEQGQKATEEQNRENTKDPEPPVNLRAQEKKEEKIPKEENPDLPESKKPVEKTDNVVDPVGKQPSNVEPEGSRSVTDNPSTSGNRRTQARKAATPKKS